MTGEEDVLGSTFLIISLYGLCGSKATLKYRAKDEVAVLGSPSLTVPTVFVEVKQH